MVIYYCEGKNARRIYNVTKKGSNWHIYNIFTDKNDSVTNALAGTTKTKKAAIEAIKTTYDHVVEIRNPGEE